MESFVSLNLTNNIIKKLILRKLNNFSQNQFFFDK